MIKIQAAVIWHKVLGFCPQFRLTMDSALISNALANHSQPLLNIGPFECAIYQLMNNAQP